MTATGGGGEDDRRLRPGRLSGCPVAFLLSGEMAFAYFIAHAPVSLFPGIDGGEAAIPFCFMFPYLATAGPGPWSHDATRK